MYQGTYTLYVYIHHVYTLDVTMYLVSDLEVRDNGDNIYGINR